MIVRKLRLQRGWSQEQLSEFSDLSIRTIQRIERGQKASVESLKSLAAVFETEYTDLEQETTMSSNNTSNTETNNTHSNQTETAMHNVSLSREEEEAMQYVKDIKDFYSHLMTYVLVISGLFAVNAFVSPEHWWAIYPALGWGIGILSHGFWVFEVINLFSPEWEKKQIEKRLGRKL